MKKNQQTTKAHQLSETQTVSKTQSVSEAQQMSKEKNKKSISSSELAVMKTLWESEKPLSIQQICDLIPNNKWAYKTVGTLLLRLEEKGAVKSVKNGRANTYTAILDKKSYTEEQTKNLIKNLYNGSVKELALSLFKTGAITHKDIEELKEMFDL